MSSVPHLHRYSSLGRALDPAFPTNRAVLGLMPIVGVGFALLSLRSAPGDWTAAISSGVLGLGSVLGCWALGREVAPDDQSAAFVAMGLGVALAIVTPDVRLLPLFVALTLARLVNRTVGPPARLTDDVAVLVLVALTAVQLRWPELWLVAALAFWTDARYDPGVARHRLVAALCALGAVAQWLLGPRADVGFVLPTAIAPTGASVAVALVTAGFVGLILATQRLESTADATGEPLSARRVRAGMVIVLVLAVLGLVGGGAPIERSGLLWATLAGVTLASGATRLTGRRRSLTSPS